MNDFKSFVEDKIKAAQKELQNIDDLIAKKAGPLLDKKKAISAEINGWQQTIKEFDKANKANKPK